MSVSIAIHIKALQKGDQEAFRVIYELYYAQLFNYAQSFVRQREMSEELVQEAFLMIWDRRQMLSSDFNLKAYLFKSIHNQALNYIRHNKIVNIHAEEAYIIGNKSVQFKEPNPFLSGALKKAIETLPARTKLIFLMSRVDGLRHKEIGKELSISEKTVEVQVRKARLMLQKKMKHYYKELK